MKHSPKAKAKDISTRTLSTNTGRLFLLFVIFVLVILLSTLFSPKPRVVELAPSQPKRLPSLNDKKEPIKFVFSVEKEEDYIFSNIGQYAPFPHVTYDGIWINGTQVRSACDIKDVSVDGNYQDYKLISAIYGNGIHLRAHSSGTLSILAYCHTTFGDDLHAYSLKAGVVQINDNFYEDYPFGIESLEFQELEDKPMPFNSDGTIVVESQLEFLTDSDEFSVVVPDKTRLSFSIEYELYEGSIAIRSSGEDSQTFIMLNGNSRQTRYFTTEESQSFRFLVRQGLGKYKITLELSSKILPET